MASELVIKISGDIKSYETALEDAQEKTAALEGKLTSLAKISAVAFAGLTAEILLSAKAFGESQKATNQLTQSLQNQGIYSDELLEKYKERASAIQELTGLDDDSVVAAQASLQALIGQTEITQELTLAMADLAEAKGIDLQSTVQLIAKGINGQVAGLQKLGIVIDENLDKQERTAKIVELVTQKFGGQAAAANQGLGAIRGLESAFGDFQEEIGKRFSPVIEIAIKNVTNFFRGLSENKPMLDLITSVIAAGTVVAGLGIAVGTAGTAFLSLKAALTAAGIATNAMSLATKALVGATGIGLLAILATEIYLNWNTFWPRMQAVYAAFVQSVTGLSDGLGKVLSGVFTFNVSKIQDGMAQIKEVLAKGYAAATAEIKPINIEVNKQDAGKLAAAQETAQKEIEIEELKQQTLQAERELALLKIGDASAQEIAIKQEQAETLKALQATTNAELKEAYQTHLDDLEIAEEEAHAISLEQQQLFEESFLASSTEFQEMDANQRALFMQQNGDKLRKSLETEKSIKQTYAQQQLEEDIKRRNQFLLDEQRFGTAYAGINRAMHSNIYQGTKSASGQLAGLVQSEQNALKNIGKAAAVTQIGIKTAESAMNIYAGFSTIPIIGPALGIAGAAAAVLFGAEQIRGVLAANEGGIVTGGIPNVDSVPAMLTPGELVVPQRNFEEVVNATAASRSGDSGGSSGGTATIELVLRDDLMDLIEARLIERSRLNISLQGAV